MINLCKYLFRRGDLSAKICNLLIAKKTHLVPAQVFIRNNSSDYPITSKANESLELIERAESLNEPSSHDQVAIICHKCKQPGHYARECPSVGTLCFRCGQTGHLSYNCPNGKACYRCGSTSHLANECPSNVCYKCTKPGHFAKDCPADKVCYRCGKSGHIARDCSITNARDVNVNE